MSLPLVSVTDDRVVVTIGHPKFGLDALLTPDEALDLAASLLTASNEANGLTSTGVFA